MTHESHDWINATTKAHASVIGEIDHISVPGLTILCHPDPGRVGEEAALPGLLSVDGERLSRIEPRFAPPTGGDSNPLMDSHLSRRPLHLTRSSDGSLRLDPAGSPTQIVINSNLINHPCNINHDDLKNGVIILLALRIALLLHSLRPTNRRPPKFDLVGENAAMLGLRREMERLADLDYPVLLRGESGTGKELVARALHEAGPRHKKPFVSKNIGGIDPGLANAELFGTVKGAYPGAVDRAGLFQRAHSGTLFLDEIGATPDEVQVKLLRVLDTQRIERVGSTTSRTVDVRLISATDADLERAMASSEFRSPLFHRLSSHELELPPLRNRRDDIGRLFFYFLRQELLADDLHRLAPTLPDSAPWVPAELVAKLAAYSWPGNVRQLRNIVRQLVVASRGKERLCLPTRLERLLRHDTQPPELGSQLTPEETPIEQVPATYRHPKEVDEAELVQALSDSRWSLQAAAKTLNVTRPSLYKLVDRCPQVRKASELGREEITDALKRCEGKLDCMVDLLEVSERGLQLRMNKLGLKK